MAEPKKFTSFIEEFGPAVEDGEEYAPPVGSQGSEEEYSFIREFGEAEGGEPEAPVEDPARGDDGRIGRVLKKLAAVGVAGGSGAAGLVGFLLSQDGEDPTGEDYGRMVMSGGARSSQGIGWLLEKLGIDKDNAGGTGSAGLAGFLVDQGGDAISAAGEAIKDRSGKSADAWMVDKLDAIGLDQEGLSPLARQAMEAEFLGEKGTGSDKWNKVKLTAAGSLLGTMAGMGAGAVFTKALATAGVGAKTAATLGYGAGEAGIAAPATGAVTEDEVRGMTHEQLLESLEYQALLEGLDLPEAEAREKAKDILADAAGGKAFAISFVTTFALSAPFGNKLDELVTGRFGEPLGRVGAAAHGAGLEATQEFLQSGAEQAAQNFALQDAQPNRSLTQDVLESAVGGAAAGGLLGGTVGLATGPAPAPFDEKSALDEIENAQRAAEERARAGGGDNLDAAIAGSAAASSVGGKVKSIFEEAAVRQLTAEEVKKLGAEPAYKRTAVRKIAQEKLIPEEEFAKAEVADQAARDSAQAEAAKVYERQQRAAAAAPAERQLIAQREAEVREAESQRDMQVAAELEAKAAEGPTNGLMAQRLERAIQKDAERTARAASVERVRAEAKARQDTAKAKATADIEGVKESATRALPDLRPDVIVGPDGVALTKAQVDEQRQRIEARRVAKQRPLTPSQLGLERRVAGLRVALETPDGATREGKSPDGSSWSTTMRGVDYGFVRGSSGADGDQVDVFVSTKKDAKFKTVFVVDQIDQNTGEFDEHKALVGFQNQADAVRAYKQQHTKGWKVGKITGMPQAQFEKWVKEGKKDAPIQKVDAPVPVVSTEADIEAIRDREARKGRRKPKVMYRLPEGTRIDMTEDTIPGTEGSELTLELIDQAGENVGGITADVDNTRKQIKIGISKVDEQLRGQGAGLEMYNTLLKEAFKRGFKLVSDTSVSAAAERVYQALERRGAKVTRNPNARQNERGDWVSDDIRNPVFTVEPIDIRLRKEDLEAELAVPKNSYRVLSSETGKDLGIVTGRDPSYAFYLATTRYGPDVAVVPLGEGDTVDDIIAGVQRVMDALPGLKGEILMDPSELPQDLYDLLREDGALGAKGLFHVPSGKVYIFASNHTSVQDAVRTVLHEGLAHKGLRVLLGDKLPGLLEDIWQNGNQAAIKRIAAKYKYDLENVVERMQATEEYIAYLAETHADAPVLRRIVDAIRQFLRTVGLLSEWTDGDIHALLREIKREVKGKPLNKITFTEEVTIAETGEVVQIEERADVLVRQMEKRMGVISKLKGCLAA